MRLQIPVYFLTTQWNPEKSKLKTLAALKKLLQRSKLCNTALAT